MVAVCDVGRKVSLWLICDSVLTRPGWGKLGTSDGVALPESVYVLRGRYAPHDWLFPQCAAVIHHGGAGVPLTSSPMHPPGRAWPALALISRA